MEIQKLSCVTGESAELAVALTWNDAAFEPGSDWALILTVKDSADDADADAVFQKATGAGITVSGSTATIATVPDDTSELAEGLRIFDIKAQSSSTGKVRRIAVGELYIEQIITRETTTSVDVITTETPLPFASVAAEIHAATSKTTPADADEFGLADSAASWAIKKLSWANLKATAKAYFDTLYQAAADALELDHVPLQSSLTLTGITPPGTTLKIPKVADANGFNAWLFVESLIIYSVSNDGSGIWIVSWQDGATGYLATKVSAATSPAGLTGWTVSEGSGQPTVAISGVDTPTALGQAAIVSHSDATKSEWGAVSLDPVQWLPRTAGIIWDADNLEWIRLTRTDGAIDATTLPDQ